MNTWDIGLNSWIIQDGNYPDFAVGQIAEFALEFWVSEDKGLSSREISATNIADCHYDTVAHVVLQRPEITVLDIGVLVYRDRPCSPLTVPQGRRVGMRMGLGVDPFFYFESLCQIPEVPPLIYSWKIRSIMRQTAPFIETVADAGPLKGRKVWVRDPQRLGYEEILRTDAWKDDECSAEYLLRCDLLPIPPKRTSMTATSLHE